MNSWPSRVPMAHRGMGTRTLQLYICIAGKYARHVHSCTRRTSAPPEM